MLFCVCLLTVFICCCFAGCMQYVTSDHPESHRIRQFIRHLWGRLGLFLIAGCFYYCCELLFRGRSHWTMFVLAGILAVCCIDVPNNIYSFDLDYRLQVLISAALCTLGEGVTGLVVNRWLHWGIWDYSSLPGSFFWEQCNILFVGVWILLIALIGIPVCDAWNYYICREEPVPYYVIGKKVVFRMKRRWWF